MGHKYFLPAGRNGFIYNHEIGEVLKKYKELKVDIYDEKIGRMFVQDITDAIKSVELQPVEVQDPPIKYLPRMDEDQYPPTKVFDAVEEYVKGTHPELQNQIESD